LKDSPHHLIQKLNVGAQLGRESEGLGVETEEGIHPFIIAEFELPTYFCLGSIVSAFARANDVTAMLVLT
jgi:hypothetical protein